MVDNFMTEWEQRERRPSLVLVDSYGNKGKGYMPAYFASAFWCVLFNGLSAGSGCCTFIWRNAGASCGRECWSGWHAC